MDMDLDQHAQSQDTVADVFAAPKTHCRNGHEQAPGNIYFHKQSGRFYCRVCRQLRDQGKIPPASRSSIWNDETIGFLRERNALHHSASRIEDAFLETFGFKVTRNAILGKLFRLGLSNPMPQVVREKRERRRGEQRELRIRLGDRGWQAKPRVEKVEPIPVMDDSHIPLGQRRQIFELELGMCKFPCGDPADHESFFFCGGVAVEGKSYCWHHHARCYGGFGRAHG